MRMTRRQLFKALAAAAVIPAAPAFATGVPIKSGVPYLIGNGGPEIFVPHIRLFADPDAKVAAHIRTMAQIERFNRR